MTEMRKDVPTHLIPTEKLVLTADETEKELNEELDTERWVFTDEPEDGVCPYCGNPYEGVTWASRVTNGKGVCPYDTSTSDFIVQFVHQYHHSIAQDAYKSIQSFCSPEYDDVLITYPADAPDYDIEQINKK